MTAFFNKEFRQQMGGEYLGARMPTVYLTSNAIDYTPHPTVGIQMAGVHLFDIVQGPGNLRQLRVVPSGSNHPYAFPAYWCPYGDSAAFQVVLGSAAQYFFTPALTGCILEINGHVVTHHGGGIKPWPPQQLAGLPFGGRVGHRKWDNNQMSTGGHVCSNVVGVRVSGVWRFYQQSFNFLPALPLARQVVSEI